MKFEVAFTRATLRHSFIARSPTWGGSLDIKAGQQRLFVRQAIWRCDPSPGHWTWTGTWIAAPGPCF